MTIKIFNGSNFNNIAQRLQVWRDGLGWTPAKKVSVYRDAGGSPFWSIAYPDLPFAVSTPIINGTGAVGTSFSINSLFFWDFQEYRSPESQTFQWQRSTSSSGPWTNRGSLSSSYSNYQIQSDDVGYFFRLQIVGTNARGSTTVNSGSSVMAHDPNYTFIFGNQFGVNANAQIILDPDSNGNFYDNSLALTGGRGLNYFFGDYKHFAIWYKSDLTNFRIYHQLYRNDRTTRPSVPDIEYEIVFTNNSNIVDIYVVNPVSTSYIESYAAYLRGFTVYKSYNSANYAAGQRFRVTLDPTTAISVASVAASTTSPSISSGWIYISEDNDSTIGTTTFSSGSGLFSPIAQNVNGSFTKSNMFFPTTPTLTGPTYVTSNTASLSWSGSNANSYNVTVTRNSDSVQVFQQTTTSTSITLSNLVTGTAYTVSVSPNSRSDVLGQFGFAATQSYTHAGVPGPPTGLSVSGTPSDDGFWIYWTVNWTAPASNGGSAITDYEYKIDYTADNGQDNYTQWFSTGSTATTRTIQAFEGNRALVRIRAVNGAGAGAESAELTLSSTPTAPGTPSATAASGGNSTISWTASNANGGTSLVYSVFRGQNQTTIANNRTFANTGSSTQANLSITDDIGGNGTTTYYYQVIGYANYGLPSAQLSGILSGTSSGLSVNSPTVNTPSLGINNTNVGINVNWSGSAGSGSTPTYAVYRGQTQAGMNTYGSGNLRANQTNTSISGDSAAASTTYYYRVDVSNNVGTGQSALASITTPGPPNTPGTPSGTANNTNNNINLSWGASGAGGGGTVTYAIYRGQNAANLPNGGTFINNTTSTSYTDQYNQPATPPVTFYYRVVPSTVWGTGTQSAVSGGISAS